MNIRIILTLGLLALIFNFNAVATVHYVDLNSTNATPPYTDWTTAATNIQNAVDAAVAGDLILVTNGVYARGVGALGYRVSVTNALTLQSVNGPAMTIIDGSNTVPCVYLTDGCVLSGFTISHGYDYQGGGVYCDSTLNEDEYPLPGSAQVLNCLVNSNYSVQVGGGVSFGIVSNSVISHNIAHDGGGGGAYSCMIYNSMLSYNRCSGGTFLAGGAAYSSLKYCIIFSNMGNGVAASDLNNCLVFSNVLAGAVFCYLTNCTVYGNSRGGVMASEYNGSLILNSIVYYNSLVNIGYSANPMVVLNSCSTPLASGAGNITNAPLFVNIAAGDYHLASNSPCINAGNNSLVIGSTDYDGNPRIVGGTVDIGAYEYQTPTSIISFAWLQQYGLPTDGSADFIDPDHDGLNNWQEWQTGTIPTNALSVLKMLSPSNTLSGLQVGWQCVSGKIYFIQRASDLAVQPSFFTLQTNLTSQASTTSFTDTTATNGGPYFYRVGVQ